MYNVKKATLSDINPLSNPEDRFPMSLAERQLDQMAFTERGIFYWDRWENFIGKVKKAEWRGGSPCLIVGGSHYPVEKEVYQEVNKKLRKLEE